MINQEVSTFYGTYSKNDRGQYIAINEDILIAADVGIEGIVGLRDEELPWAQYAQIYTDNDARVSTSKKTHVFYERCLYKGKPQVYRATKTPYFGCTGKVIGIHGVSVLISDRCLIPLTKQQTACLKQLALGNSYKTIGKELGLSEKTVEHYLDAVKVRLNCHTRAELIMQAIERGLIEVF